MTEPARVDEAGITPEQEALAPRIRKGDLEALGEFFSLGLGTKVTVGPALGAGEATG